MWACHKCAAREESWYWWHPKKKQKKVLFLSYILGDKRQGRKDAVADSELSGQHSCLPSAKSMSSILASPSIFFLQPSVEAVRPRCWSIHHITTKASVLSGRVVTVAAGVQQNENPVMLHMATLTVIMSRLPLGCAFQIHDKMPWTSSRNPWWNLTEQMKNDNKQQRIYQF